MGAPSQCAEEAELNGNWYEGNYYVFFAIAFIRGCEKEKSMGCAGMILRMAFYRFTEV